LDQRPETLVFSQKARRGGYRKRWSSRLLKRTRHIGGILLIHIAIINKATGILQKLYEEPSMAVNVCNPSNSGGRDRRIIVRYQPWAKNIYFLALSKK
jgi:hypothetical protein